MSVIRVAQVAAIAAGLALCAQASAQTLYKLVDKNGKVTYSETVPKGFDGKVTRMDIDPNANTATLPKPAQRGTEGQSGSKSAEEYVRESTTRRDDAESKLQDAKTRLDEARAALNDAMLNPGEGDIQWIGNKSGGTRPVHTEAYTTRIEKLKADVEKAEEAVKRLERGS